MPGFTEALNMRLMNSVLEKVEEVEEVGEVRSCE